MQDRITTSIPTAASMIGVGRTTLYGLIRSGEVETIRIGSRRLVVVDSLHAYIARQCAEQTGGSK